MNNARECPECMHRHAGTFIDRRDILQVLNCPLYRPNIETEAENRLFAEYERFINFELDRWKEDLKKDFGGVGYE